MSRLSSADLPLAEALMGEVRSQLGRVPNLYKAMAVSPTALNGYLDFRAAL